tara:strand:- start:3272 stop:3676 length:405 start_codon:yes stop_codon:yes gene_type:complete
VGSNPSGPTSKSFLTNKGYLYLIIMFPKVNPRQMKKMMRQLGMEMEELESEEVIIKLKDGQIIISKPAVNVVKAQNQKTYQITGEEKFEQAIAKEDIKLVAEQADVSEEEALETLQNTGGDLAKAIMQFKEDEN